MNGDRSREAFGRFLDFLGEKGLMAPATAQTRKVSALKLLSILSPEEASDVTAIDIDGLARRFSNLHGQKYNPGSLNTYKSRLKSSMSDFRSYLENPLSFKPAVQNRERQFRSKRDVSEASKSESEAPQHAELHRHSAAPIMAGANTMPIPIRADLTILIHGLPHDLTQAEAKKISGVINALAASA